MKSEMKVSEYWNPYVVVERGDNIVAKVAQHRERTGHAGWCTLVFRDRIGARK